MLLQQASQAQDLPSNARTDMAAIASLLPVAELAFDLVKDATITSGTSGRSPPAAGPRRRWPLALKGALAGAPAMDADQARAQLLATIAAAAKK